MNRDVASLMAWSKAVAAKKAQAQAQASAASSPANTEQVAEDEPANELKTPLNAMAARFGALASALQSQMKPGEDKASAQAEESSSAPQAVPGLASLLPQSQAPDSSSWQDTGSSYQDADASWQGADGGWSGAGDGSWGDDAAYLNWNQPVAQEASPSMLNHDALLAQVDLPFFPGCHAIPRGQAPQFQQDIAPQDSMASEIESRQSKSQAIGGISKEQELWLKEMAEKNKEEERMQKMIEDSIADTLSKHGRHTPGEAQDDQPELFPPPSRQKRSKSRKRRWEEGSPSKAEDQVAIFAPASRKHLSSSLRSKSRDRDRDRDRRRRRSEKRSRSRGSRGRGGGRDYEPSGQGRDFSPGGGRRTGDREGDRLRRQAGIPPRYEEPAVHKELMVPMRFTSRLIGKGGSKIALIRRNTGADITIRQGRPEEEFSKVVVVGTGKSVGQAEIEIWETLGMEPGSAVKEFEIPPEFVSAVIGPAGSYIAHMRAQAGGCAIGVRIPEPPEVGPHKVIIGPSPPEKIEIAYQLVLERMENYRNECLQTLAAPGSSKFRVVPCKFYMVGTCRKGELCPFSHADNPDFPMDAANREDSLARLEATGAGHLRSIPCKFFQQGKCRRGTACSFSHADAEAWPELTTEDADGNSTWDKKSSWDQGSGGQQSSWDNNPPGLNSSSEGAQSSGDKKSAWDVNKWGGSATW